MNKSTNNKNNHLSSTPDANTSRGNYKPRFIKKFAKMNQEELRNGMSVSTPQESVQQCG